MAAFKAIGNGAGAATRRPRLLIDLWVINIVYSLFIAAPLYALFKADLGHSLLGRNLQPLDFIWLGDFIYKYQDMAPAALAMILVSLLIYTVLYVFLNGGIIGRLLDREGPTTPQAFFADCGRYFWRFARLFLVSLLFYALAFGIILEALSVLFNPVLENARTEWTVFWISDLRTVIALLLLSLVHMVFDYARILVVAGDERRILRALRAAFAFLGTRFFRAWSLYLLIGAGFLGGMAVYFLIGAHLPDSGLFWLGVGILWGQTFIVFRLWTKMIYFAAQAEFYRMSHY
ncbi:MAG: hypothetical protein ABR951_07160 [Candidatus Aminicenantales bacterium]|jgi:hypothetical protein